MRKAIFITFVLAGTLVGLLAAAKDEWETRVIMMGVGALFGSAIGGALSRPGKRKPAVRRERNVIPGTGVTSEDLAANYWRDRGHAPFMKPPDASKDGNAIGAPDVD